MTVTDMHVPTFSVDVKCKGTMNLERHSDIPGPCAAKLNRLIGLGVYLGVRKWIHLGVRKWIHFFVYL